MTGVITCHPEEPYAKSASTVPWEALGVTRAPTRCNATSGPAGLSPKGRGGGRASAALPLLDDVQRHRLRRGALHLPARRSRQNANLFLREP